MSITQPLAVGAALALLAGCSGGDDPVERPEPAKRASQEAEFRARATAACERLSTAVAKVEPPDTFPAELRDFDRGSDDFLERTHGHVRTLASLDPPPELRADYARMVAELEASERHARTVQELVRGRNDDTDALWAAWTASDTSRAQAMEVAERLGLGDCTRLVPEHEH